MVAHVVAVLREAVDEVVVVTSSELDPPELPARVVRDPTPGEGPLAGIAEGLAHVGAELAYVCGTDAPFLRPDFVRAVLAAGVPAAPVVDGFVQTLAASYPRAGREQALALLARGRRRPLDLLEAVGYRALAPEELPGLDALRGFNTPEEYLAAVAESEANATATLEFLGRARRLTGLRGIEVPVGRLAEVLSHAPAPLELCRGERVAPPFLVSLGGRDFVRDARVPIGPGERVVVLDASAGG
jgi:molybdopterin-guanine dinucleotide biosynthesis protein A